MGSCSETNTHKELKDNDEQSSSGKRESLLSIFIDYFWNEESVERSKYEDFQLKKWIRSNRIDVNHGLWLPSHIKRNKRSIKMINLLKSKKEIPRWMRKSRILMRVKLVYEMRRMLSLLLYSGYNINYTDNNRRTILHIFLEELLMKTTDILSQKQLLKVQTVIEKLIARGASLYTVDSYERSSFHVVAMSTNKQILELLISFLTNVNQCEHRGNTALHIVVGYSFDLKTTENKLGYMDIVRNLVFRGADVNKQNEKGVSAVHLAARNFQIDMLKFFKNHGANFKLRSKEDQTIFHFISKSPWKLKDTSKITETMNFLASRSCDFEIYDKNELTPLHQAAEYGNVEVVSSLIELGANVNCQTKKLSLTPLHSAARRNQLNIIQKLVESGADVNSETIDGMTPISFAVLFGSFESMRYLIDQGADLYRRDKFRGWSLLHFAAHGMDSDVCDTFTGRRLNKGDKAKKLNYLIDKGFEVNDAGICGITPLQLATLANDSVSVKTLIEHGANVNFQNDASELTSLHLASLIKNLQIAKILIEAGADVNCRGGNQQLMSLHLVVLRNVKWRLGKYNHIVKNNQLQRSYRYSRPSYINQREIKYRELISILIKNGADVNAKTALGKSALHLATLLSDVTIMSILLEEGASPNVQDNQCQTPLIISLRTNYTTGLICLLDSGADINDEDVSQEIMKSNDELKNIVIHHAIKLKSLGLPFAKVYKPLVEDPKFAKFHENCLKQVKKLIEHRNGDFSLYEFLHMSVRHQCNFTEEIPNLINSLHILCYLFVDIIDSACKEAVYRKSLLQLAKHAWYQMSNFCLPDICVENILSHLNNRYLDVIVQCANQVEPIVINQGEVPYVLNGMV